MSALEARVSFLEGLIGGDAVEVDAAQRLSVAPARVGAVSELLRWAFRERVVVRTAPARPLDGRPKFPGAGEILLRLDRLQAAPNLHEEAGTVDVAGGTTGAELAWQLHREGRWIQPRPSPFYRDPIGVGLAGPLLAGEWVAFGMWESPLMALEAVLLDGRVMRAGVAPRSAAGPDYRAFLLGARDRIGVITGATWRTAARSVPALFAVRFARRGDALALVREHVSRGWRPWTSRVIPGRSAARWNEPGAPRAQGAAVVLLCHRAEGDRAQLIRRTLHDGVRHHGGTVLEPAEARGWYEGSFLAVCRDGAPALEGLDHADGADGLATAWIAVPWAGLATLWQALHDGKGARARAQVLGEAFRPEGGVLQVRLLRRGRARVGATAAVRWLLRCAAEHGGRLAGLHDAAGRPVAPPLPATDADALLDDMAGTLGGEAPSVLNPAREGGR